MKGIYVLIIEVSKDVLIDVGAIGKIRFEKGKYAYVGSAQNNLEKRVSRHLSKNKKTRWHIDYLLKNESTSIIKIFYKEAPKTEECNTAKSLTKDGIPVYKFGCSDCRCISHLFKIKNIKAIEKMNFKEYMEHKR